jgi:hypothetical protein
LAAYLIKHYEDLEGRIFKKKNIRKFNRRWYEYIWPRDPRIVLSKPKIISPRLSKEVRFAIDTKGILPQDSCVCLVPTSKTGSAWSKLEKELSAVLEEKVTSADMLKYCLPFLNSKYAQERFTTGHRPRPGEVYAVTESMLREILVPPPKGKQATASILDLVSRLIESRDKKETDRHEAMLANIIDPILKAGL